MFAEAVTGSVLNWVDLLCLAVIGAFLVYGVVRGFMLQLLGICVLVGSIALAGLLDDPLGGWVRGRLTTLNEVNAKWIAFAVVLLIGLAVGTGISHLVRGQLAKAKLLAHDRLLGGFLGVVKGWLLVVLILQLALNLTMPNTGEPTGISASIINSQSGDVARWSTQKIFVFLPPDLSDDLHEYDRLNPRAKPESAEEGGSAGNGGK